MTTMLQPDTPSEQLESEKSGMQIQVRTPTQIFWTKFKKHKLALLSAAYLLLLVVVAIFAPTIAPYDPNEINTQILPSAGVPLGPSWSHPFGTDDLGRDYFSRAIVSTRISLSVGLVSVGISLGVGTFVGAVSGYAGGRVDEVLMRLVDLILTFPSFFLILTIQSMLEPSIYNVMVVIGLVSWATIARLVRGEVLAIKNEDYIEAARALGLPDSRIIRKHILPQVSAVLIVAATIGLPAAILTESALSFLGLGVQPPTASWGNMLQDADVYMRTAWWMGFFPGLLISLTVLAFNFLGDGLRDALDPKQLRQSS